MKLFLLFSMGISACVKQTNTTKNTPTLGMHTYYFDVSLEKEEINPSHDEERHAPLPTKVIAGEEVGIAVHISLDPQKREGIMKIKYMEDPKDCATVKLTDAKVYENNDIEISFRKKISSGREIRGVFIEENFVGANIPYHKRFFYHLKILREINPTLAFLFSMKDDDSFIHSPEEIKERFFTADDSKHCLEEEKET